jgi:hypothetical protein
MEPHHSFFEAFGAASSINVNEYLTEMWDDPSSPRKSVQQWSDGTRSWWGVKQPRVLSLPPSSFLCSGAAAPRTTFVPLPKCVDLGDFFLVVCSSVRLKFVCFPC